jgi:hypothetical protein
MTYIPNPLPRLLHQGGQLPVAYIADQLKVTYEEAAYLVEVSLDAGLCRQADTHWTAPDGSTHPAFELP